MTWCLVVATAARNHHENIVQLLNAQTEVSH
jgi:hypothetical protein